MGDVDIEAGLSLLHDDCPTSPTRTQFQAIRVEHLGRPGQKVSGRCSDVVFKGYVTLSALVLWTAHSLLMRSSLRDKAESELYFPTTAVVLAESSKWVITLFFIVKGAHWDGQGSVKEVKRLLLSQPGEMLRAAVPSILYAAQNNLDFIALSRIEPGLYVVTSQLKVVLTAILMVVLLGRRFSWARWAAIFVLMIGVASVQLDGHGADQADAVDGVPGHDEKETLSKDRDYVVGISCVVGACFLSALAGVWFEKMLKERAGEETGFWGEESAIVYFRNRSHISSLSLDSCFWHLGERILSRLYTHYIHHCGVHELWRHLHLTHHSTSGQCHQNIHFLRFHYSHCYWVCLLL